MEKTIGHIVRFFVSLLVVAIIAAFYAILTIDLNDYKKEIETATADATGRNLTLEGDTSLAWSVIPILKVETARFSNAKWGTKPDMVSLDSLEVRLALWPLLQKQIQVTKVVLEHPVILIETNKEGKGNWELDLPESAPEEPETEPFIQSVIINDLDITDAQIVYLDGVTGEKQTFDLEQLSIDIADLNQPLDLLIKAVLNELPLSVEGQLGGVQALMDNTNTLVDLKANVAGVGLALAGDIAKPHLGKGVSLDIELKTNDEALAGLLGPESGIPEFGDLSIKGNIANDIETEAINLDIAAILEGLELLVKGQVTQPQKGEGIALNIDLATSSTAITDLSGTELSTLGDIKLTGLLSGGGQGYKFSDMLLNAGETDLAGDIQVILAEDKPSVEMDLSSNLIDLTALSSGKDEGDEKLASSDKLFSDDPLVLDTLKQVNAKVNFDAKTVKTSGAVLQDVHLEIDLTDGHLRAVPLKAGFAGSQINGEFNLNAGNENAVLASKVQVNGFKLHKVEALKDAISGGNTDVFIQAKGQGASVRQLMAGLNGKAIIKVAESQIADGTLDILGADFFTELFNMLNPFAKEQKGTELACAVVNFNIRDGIATADKGIAIRTDKMNIVGDGTINLKNEKIDIGITPEARTGLGMNMTDLVGLVRVGGTLAEPSALVDKTAVLGAGLSTGAAVATGGLSIVAKGVLDRATTDVNPCQTALGIKPKTKN